MTEETLVPLDESDFIAHSERQDQKIRELEAALAEKEVVNENLLTKLERSNDAWIAAKEQIAALEDKYRKTSEVSDRWEALHKCEQIAALTAENERLREALGEPICPECQGIGTFSQEGCRQGEYICVKCGFVKQEALRGGGKKTAQIGDAYNDEIAREIWISYDDKEAKG